MLRRCKQKLIFNMAFRDEIIFAGILHVGCNRQCFYNILHYDKNIFILEF